MTDPARRTARRHLGAAATRWSTGPTAVRDRHRARHVLVPPGARLGRPRPARRRRRGAQPAARARRASSTSTSGSSASAPRRRGSTATRARRRSSRRRSPGSDPGEGRYRRPHRRVRVASRIGADADGASPASEPDGVHRIALRGASTCRPPRRRAAVLAVEARAATPVAREAWRIEPAVPVQPPDVDDTTIPQEAFLERDAVSFTKGCFLGQELVCRIDSRGHVNRFLRRFAAIEGDWPPVGAEIVVDGKVVGALTSVAPASCPPARSATSPRGRAPGRGRAATGTAARGFDAPGR